MAHQRARRNTAPSTEAIILGLQFLSPNMPESEWSQVGRALARLGIAGAFEAFDDWSAGSDSYDRADLKSRWRAWERHQGTGPGWGTFLKMCRDSGADFGNLRPESPAERAERDRQAAQRKAEADQVLQAQRQEAARRMARLAGVAKPADPQFPALVAKGVAPTETMRQVSGPDLVGVLGFIPDYPGRRALQGAAAVPPALVFPLHGPDGAASGFQVRWPDGSKYFPHGFEVSGRYWPCQALPTEAPEILLVGEGCLSALSAREATGLPAVAGLFTTNLPNAARTLRSIYASTPLLFLGDVDLSGDGQKYAEKGAQACGGHVVLPDFSKVDLTKWTGAKPPSDFNDLAQLAGLEEVRRQVLEAVAKAMGSTSKEAVGGEAAGEQQADTADLFDLSWPRPEWRPESTQSAGDSDLGNAARLFDHAGRDLLYVSEIGWHTWGGNRWFYDPAAAGRHADGLARLVLLDAATAASRAASATGDDRETWRTRAAALQSWARRCEKAATIESALQLLERRLIIGPTEADTDHFLLAVGNGVLDLRTGQLRPARRGDFITKGTGIAFDPAATCPVFERTLARIFRKHTGLISFMRRVAGYLLTGSTIEQCIFVFNGNGANGKSTLVNVLEELLGDYAKQAAPDLLLSKAGDRHPTEIADLRGARLVSAMETGEGRRLAESLVKQMSGGDKLKGRYMHRDFFEFVPSFKLVMATNHRPGIRGTDHGIWRRIRLIPFVETIGDDEKDPTLGQKLRAEMPGILAWAVRGCLEWQKEGLKPPEIVTTETNNYRQSEDVLARFIEERCEIAPGKSCPATPLFQAWNKWCDENGEYAGTQTAFGKKITERGYERTRSGGVVYLGIAVKPEPPETKSEIPYYGRA
jgi:putative DNA primase/helicase